jgi:hypothetical protein
VTSALVGGEWSTLCPGRFITEERALGASWVRDWVDPGTGLDEAERRKILPLPGFQLQTLGRPARSQSLYRLHYPDSSLDIQII